jgi:hypothetical protein
MVNQKITGSEHWVDGTIQKTNIRWSLKKTQAVSTELMAKYVTCISKVRFTHRNLIRLTFLAATLHNTKNEHQMNNQKEHRQCKHHWHGMHLAKTI